MVIHQHCQLEHHHHQSSGHLSSASHSYCKPETKWHLGSCNHSGGYEIPRNSFTGNKQTNKQTNTHFLPHLTPLSKSVCPLLSLLTLLGISWTNTIKFILKKPPRNSQGYKTTNTARAEESSKSPTVVVTGHRSKALGGSWSGRGTQKKESRGPACSKHLTTICGRDMDKQNPDNDESRENIIFDVWSLHTHSTADPPAASSLETDKYGDGMGRDWTVAVRRISSLIPRLRLKKTSKRVVFGLLLLLLRSFAAAAPVE